MTDLTLLDSTRVFQSLCRVAGRSEVEAAYQRVFGRKPERYCAELSGVVYYHDTYSSHPEGFSFARGAFTESAADMLKAGYLELVCGHKLSDPELVVGTVTRVYEGEHDGRSALLFTARIRNTAGGKSVAEQIAQRLERGPTVGVSVGFTQAMEYTTVRADGGEHIVKGLLREISLTDCPAMPGARVLSLDWQGQHLQDRQAYQMRERKRLVNECRAMQQTFHRSCPQLQGLCRFNDESGDRGSSPARRIQAERERIRNALPAVYRSGIWSEQFLNDYLDRLLGTA
jgi:HK97 family phage prohead protease